MQDDRAQKKKTVSVAAITTGIIAIALFFVIMYLVTSGKVAGFDDPVREFFYSLRNDALTVVAIVITTMSNKWFMVGICILLLIIPWTRFRFGVPLSAGALLTVGINEIVKMLVERPRPEVVHLVEETGHSFPSGHSINSMFFYGLAIWLVWHYVPSEKWRAILIPIIAIPLLFVGPTRVYLGVHYPTDVLAGWCLGFAAIILIIEIILILEGRRREKANDLGRG